MDGQNMKSITVVVAGRPYPLKINEGDEQTIRKIVKELNEKINRFQLSYSDKDKQDGLAMVALTYAVDLHKAKQSADLPFSATEKLSQLDALLDQLLIMGEVKT